jgi:sugar transferase (PEP-CTERM/EpsH1 system associated)
VCAEVKVENLHPWLGRLRGLPGVLHGEPLTWPYYRNAALAQWVRSIVRTHNIRKALVFSSAMAQYLDAVPDVSYVIDFVDVDSAKWTEYGKRRIWPLSAIYRREGRLLLQFERDVASRAAAACFVTAEEAKLFQRLAPECRQKTFAASNGVDARYFSPAHDFPSPYPPGEQPVVFTGAMDYWPNVDAVCWFARTILPQLRVAEPAIRFYVVGMNPRLAVRRLAGEGVVVTGRVPDVRPYLRHARVAVAPLRVARGLQNKVLEAMAMARPVVATEGAAVGLSAQGTVDIEVARNDADFVRAVLKLMDPARGNAMGAAARQRVLADYDWGANLAPIGQLLAARGPAPHCNEPSGVATLAPESKAA